MRFARRGQRDQRVLERTRELERYADTRAGAGKSAANDADSDSHSDSKPDANADTHTDTGAHTHTHTHTHTNSTASASADDAEHAAGRLLAGNVSAGKRRGHQRTRIDHARG